LLGSLHCMGMCGPIAFMLPVDRNNPYKKAGQISLYHFGRILSYAIIGLVFGLLGKSLYIFGIQQQLSIGIGVLMILLVLIPVEYSSRFKITQPIYRIISKIKSGLGSALKSKSPDTFLTIGFLNGFLPCGLVYMAVFGAIAMGNVIESSFYMMLFGLGTIPLMTTAVYIGKFLNHNIKHKIQKAIPIFVVIIGVLFILRGLGLGIPYVSPEPVVEIVESAIDCH
ncbi:MAG: sulfite exporter TauE/SafE family protein, partial [Bacteroidota bacterium]